MSEDEYTVEIIEDKDVEDVMELLQRTFFVDEPLNKAVDLLYQQGSNCPELEEYCRKDMLEGLSVKAVDKNGKIVGVCINGISPLKEEDNGNDLLSQAQRCPNPKFQKILHILARREAGAKLWEKFPGDQYLVEVKVTATDPEWRRKGIMNRLVKETERLVKQRNIRLLRLDTSSFYSAKSAQSQHFTCVYAALYSDLKLDGVPLIVPEPPHLEDRVYIKQL